MALRLMANFSRVTSAEGALLALEMNTCTLREKNTGWLKLKLGKRK